MATPIDLFATPHWVDDLRAAVPVPTDSEALMRHAIDLARENVERGGGPFGALIATLDGRIVEVGWNCVIPTHDSTAHAEIVALRRAQRRLGTHDLSGHILYSSCEPCIQCFGAIYWSGLSACYAAASRDDAQALGFDEGPMSDDLWARAHENRGLRYVPSFLRDERALAPMRAYTERGGPLY